MSTGETTTVKYIRSLLTMTDEQLYDPNAIWVYGYDSSGNPQAIGNMRTFYKYHYQIYVVMRVLVRIMKRQDLGINIIPLRRADTISEGSIEKNTITFNLESVKPGKTTQENRRTIREEGSRFRYEVRYRDPGEDGNEVAHDVFGQWMDNIVRFQLYGRTALETYQLSVFLRQFMQVYAARLQEVGVPIVRFRQGGSLGSEDPNAYDTKEVIFMDYLIRTEDLYTKESPLIKTIDIIQMNDNDNGDITNTLED